MIKLDRSNLGLTNIPTDILKSSKLSNLKILYLRGNQIENIPKEIELFLNLTCLDLSCNKRQKVLVLSHLILILAYIFTNNLP